MADEQSYVAAITARAGLCEPIAAVGTWALAVANAAAEATTVLPVSVISVQAFVDADAILDELERRHVDLDASTIQPIAGETALAILPALIRGLRSAIYQPGVPPYPFSFIAPQLP